VRWSRAEHLHLTLLFFARLRDDRIDALIAAMQDTPLPGGDLELEWHAGAFEGRGSRNDVVFLPPEPRASEALRTCQTELIQRVAAAGLEVERRSFQPHLTLGRWRDPRTVNDLTHLFRHSPERPLALDGGRVVLYRSHLGAGPPRYEVLAERLRES
jgi:2'-5' RNA ligase